MKPAMGIKRPAEALCAAVERLPRHRWSMLRSFPPTPTNPDAWTLTLKCRECGLFVPVIVWAYNYPTIDISTSAPVPPCSFKLHLD